jgi:hypothetical protein
MKKQTEAERAESLIKLARNYNLSPKQVLELAGYRKMNPEDRADQKLNLAKLAKKLNLTKPAK